MNTFLLLNLHFLEHTIIDAPFFIAALMNFSPLSFVPLIAKKIKFFFISLLFDEIPAT